MDDERYQRIETALCRGQTMSPIVAYLLGGDYYVLDGHRRVAAAKALGQVFILRCAGDQPVHAVTCGQDCLAA